MDEDTATMKNFPREIGGYFGLEQLQKHEWYSGLIALNTGRNALLYLARAKNIQKLYLPYYLCDSVSKMCLKNGISIDFYHITPEFHPDFGKALGENEYLYVVNYYGQIDNETAKKLKNKYKRIILDNAHAFYQTPVVGIDTIYSCRKFFGVPDGAYLFTDASLDISLEIDISKERMKHLLGRFEGTASDYYDDFKANDASFSNEPLKGMSALTLNILGAIDYHQVAKKRNANFCYLKDHLDQYNGHPFVMPYAPYSYPFYRVNGMDLKQRLSARFIYVATLWPNVLSGTEKGSVEYEYAENILPLPCDQRYDKEDMDFIVKELKTCIS